MKKLLRLLIIAALLSAAIYLINWSARGVARYRDWENRILSEFSTEKAEILIRKYDAEIKRKPLDGKFYYMRAMVYLLWATKTKEPELYLARMKGALDNLLAAEILLKGKKLQLLYRKMIVLYELKNYRESLHIAKILFKRNYMKSSTWNYLISSLSALGKIKEAVKFALDSPQMLKNRENLKTSSALCSTLIKSGRFEDAEKILMTMLTSKNKAVRIKTLKFLGWLYYEKGNLSGAEKYFRKALDLEKNAENYWLLGRILQLEGKAQGEYYLRQAEKLGYRGGKVEVQP